ncbi:hypothetical protein, partial [Cryobacterium sp. Hh38]|uniref:hypothetical protein n=1 Tax=Cryobacterium sp. Hh38 TaxID=1259156 RepID=UPI001A7E2720
LLSFLRSSRGTPSPPSTTLFGTIPVPYPRLTERAAKADELDQVIDEHIDLNGIKAFHAL